MRLAYFSFCIAVIMSQTPLLCMGDTYLDRRNALPVPIVGPFEADPCDFETVLDSQDFQELLKMSKDQIFSDPDGWTILARIGGRPFRCFDTLTVNDNPVNFNASSFDPGTSNVINQGMIGDYFAQGKTINRLEFLHKDDVNSYPIVLVITPDGFLNAAGAVAPRLQGAAARLGFIGEPFGPNDFVQHTDNLSITVIDSDTILLLFDVHSEAGEGVVEIRVTWNDLLRQPELDFKLAQVARFPQELGFFGHNFMKGPTLFGIQGTGSKGGIQAFHDARSLLIEFANGVRIKNLLIPPVSIQDTVRETLFPSAPLGTRIIIDQPQGVTSYFSKDPGVKYEERADFILSLEASTQNEVAVKRAQIAVDLESENPEAQETVNIFLSANRLTTQLDEFEVSYSPDGQDFEALVPGPRLGVVYVSDQQWPDNSLYLLPLTVDGLPAGIPQPLTDGVIKDPKDPDVSVDGRYVMFDYVSDAGQRVAQLDMYRGTVKRLTIDPFASGRSYDRRASLSPDLMEFAFISNRGGSDLMLLVEDVSTGLASGFGNAVTCATDADWSPTRDEFAVVCRNELRLFDRTSSSYETLTSEGIPGLKHPAFSPSGGQIAFASNSGISIINRDGSNEMLVDADGEHPTWVGESKLIFQREDTSEIDLYLFDLVSAKETRLTPANGINCSQPAYLRSDAIFDDGFEIGITE